MSRRELQRELELQDARIEELEDLIDRLSLENWLINLNGDVALLNSLVFPPEDEDDWF